MTTDFIQTRHTRPYLSAFRYPYRSDAVEDKDGAGIELTRMQTFLEGRQDIFDILQGLAANTDRTHIPYKQPVDEAPVPVPEKGWFGDLQDSFWARFFSPEK